MLSLLPGRPQASLPQHERIIAAIRDRDPKAAEAAMREHIASVIEALRAIDQLGGPA
jgi:DNA-binding FadR family transcriptional regulator